VLLSNCRSSYDLLIIDLLRQKTEWDLVVKIMNNYTLKFCVSGDFFAVTFGLLDLSKPCFFNGVCLTHLRTGSVSENYKIITH
jgi:hypothetical protein